MIKKFFRKLRPLFSKSIWTEITQLTQELSVEKKSFSYFYEIITHTETSNLKFVLYQDQYGNRDFDFHQSQCSFELNIYNERSFVYYKKLKIYNDLVMWKKYKKELSQIIFDNKNLIENKKILYFKNKLHK